MRPCEKFLRRVDALLLKNNAIGDSALDKNGRPVSPRSPEAVSWDLLGCMYKTFQDIYNENVRRQNYDFGQFITFETSKLLVRGACVSLGLGNMIDANDRWFAFDVLSEAIEAASELGL